MDLANKVNIAGLELLWESANPRDLSFALSDQLTEIKELREFAARSFYKAKEVSDIVDTEVFEIRSIAQEIKDRAERVTILLECTNNWHEQPKEGNPVRIIDNFRPHYRPKKRAVGLR
jgi:hypothetical protein